MSKVYRFLLWVFIGLALVIMVGVGVTVKAQTLSPDRPTSSFPYFQNRKPPSNPYSYPFDPPSTVIPSPPKPDRYLYNDRPPSAEIIPPPNTFFHSSDDSDPEYNFSDDSPPGQIPGEISDRRNLENAVIFWDNLTLDAIRFTRPGPPVVARVLAMVHTAQYEAWSQYDATAVGTLLGAKYRRPVEERTTQNKNEAMSYAAYRVLVDLFPDLFRDLANSPQNYRIDINNTSTNPDTPAGLGNLAAAAVLTYRHDDGANQLGDRHPGAYTDYTNYQPVNTPTQVNDLNAWQPLATSNGSFQGGCVPNAGVLTVQTYVGPHWGLVTPFALDDGEEITPSSPPARYPSPEFTRQAQEILDISANLTDRQKAISEYWVDGPASELPPGHWALISQLVSQRRHHRLDDDIKLFFAVSNANLDAGILAWKIKRVYNSVRPITAIRELFRGQKVRAWGGPGKGTELINGEDWEPYQDRCFVTPAFPEFISGHSTFSAASAEVLKSFTGSDEFPSVHTVYDLRLGNLEQPLKLTWQTFSEAADEAGISRRYGGIHFTQGDLVGRELGRKVGARAWQKAERFFTGTAAPVTDMSQQIDRILVSNNFDQVFN
jgi:hypothetical protein